MNNYMLDELQAADYRREKMEYARLHNMAFSSRRNLTLGLYRTLGRLGALLESWGARIQERYTLPASDTREILAHSTK